MFSLQVPIWINKGTFSFPAPNAAPIVMVGPGTGVAPFRSFISEAFASPDPPSQEFLLFFGCRGKRQDYYFQKEWRQLEERYPKLFKICTAFSRDKQDKEYVQHLILKEEFHIRRCIWEKKGSFFIAGNSKQMPDQVQVS